MKNRLNGHSNDVPCGTLVYAPEEPGQGLGQGGLLGRLGIKQTGGPKGLSPGVLSGGVVREIDKDEECGGESEFVGEEKKEEIVV